MSKFQVISPIDNSVYAECQLHNRADIDRALLLAKSTQNSWQSLSVAERKPYIEKFIKAFEGLKDRISDKPNDFILS